MAAGGGYSDEEEEEEEEGDYPLEEGIATTKVGKNIQPRMISYCRLQQQRWVQLS
jgi:hypothetical protein